MFSQARMLAFATILFATMALSLKAEASPLKLLDFSANAIYVSQPGGANSWSGQASWTPMLDLEVVGIRGELGGSLLKSALGSSFFVTTLQGFAWVTIVPMVLRIEVGGGMETWAGNGGTHGILSGNLVIPIAAVIDRIFAGYSKFFLPGNSTNEFKFGLGFDL